MYIQLKEDSIDNLNKIIEENKTNIILLDFWSKRCEYCRIAAAAVNYIHDKNEDKIILIQIEVDNFPFLSTFYNIHILPTQILLIKNKTFVFSGIEDVDNLIQQLTNTINKI